MMGWALSCRLCSKPRFPYRGCRNHHEPLPRCGGSSVLWEKGTERFGRCLEGAGVAPPGELRASLGSALPCRARRGRLLLLLRLCRHFPAGALHPSLPAGGSTRSGAAGPGRALRLGQPAMASLAAQDSYLQGLARRAGVQHSPESRKRKFGTANGRLRFWFVGVWAWQPCPHGVLDPRLCRVIKNKNQSAETRSCRTRCTHCTGSPGNQWFPFTEWWIWRAGILWKCASMLGLFK